MRVISGKYKGRKIDGFEINGTRPTMNRVKESLFGMIQNKLEDSICLDLFAGTGSLGIEAMSMNSKKCYFVEKNPEMIKILKNNIKGIENTVVISGDYKKALKEFDEQIDIVFLDPPYDDNLITPAIKLLKDYNLLKDSAYIICEYEKEKIDCNLKIIKEKKYGNKNIRIYKNETHKKSD